MTIFKAENLNQQRTIGEEFSQQINFPSICFLLGSMGVGKTSFVQGIMKGLGYTGVVTSPTYNLIHEYDCKVGKVSHIDLYRLEQPQEIEDIALYDVIDSSVLTLIEWPEKAIEILPEPNVTIEIQSLEQYRKISINAH